MIAIDNTVISDNLHHIKFICDMNACKGACCVEGDAGAPLEEEECHQLTEHIAVIRDFMTEEGKIWLEKQDPFLEIMKGVFLTPLVDGKECIYTVFEDGITRCAIENAFAAGAIPFPKPVSCHLYPVRISPYKDFDAVNYHEWHICEAALIKGKAEGTPLYAFLKDALIRKYGSVWYAQLVERIHKKTSGR